MRRILIALLIITAAVGADAVAQCCHDRSPRRHYSCDRDDRCDNGRYTIVAGTVYFGYREVDGASASGFKTLRDGYGKDPWTVYFEGVEVKGASASSFKVLGDWYAKDP